MELIGDEAWTLLRPNGNAWVADAVEEQLASAVDDMELKSDAEIVAKTVILDEPGRWTLNSQNTDGPQSVSLLVTVAASESRTDPLPAGQLQALGMSPEIAVVRDATQAESNPALASQLDASELESRQKFWQWLLLGGLACLALEGIYSYILEKRQQPELA